MIIEFKDVEGQTIYASADHVVTIRDEQREPTQISRVTFTTNESVLVLGTGYDLSMGVNHARMLKRGS